MGVGVVIALVAGAGMFVVVGWIVYKGIFAGPPPPR